MKIIDYKPHNTAYLKRVQNCQKFFTYNGFDFYLTEKEKSRTYFIHINGTDDLLDYLGCNSTSTPEEVMETIKLLPEERLKQFATVEGKLDRIHQALATKSWTSNGDALFCRLVGQPELADAVQSNRDNIYKLREAEDRQRKEKEKAECTARELEEKQKLAEQLNQAEQDMRAGKFITKESFELLADKYGIVLSIKFIGWLRKWCGDIQIVKNTEESPKGCVWENKYITRYYGDKKHRSGTISRYAEKLAEAMGI